MRIRSKSTISRTALAVAVMLFLTGALLGEAGAQTWGKLYHGPWTEYWTGTTFYGSSPTADGGYILTGSSNGRGVILRTQGDGSLLWSKLVQGNGYQRDSYMIDAVQAKNGDIIVTGQIYADQTVNPNATPDGSWDIYVTRLDPSGETVWEKCYGRKTVGGADVHDAPQYIYKSCPQTGGACDYVVTGAVVYSGVSGCPYNGYRAAQTLLIDENGSVKNDFLMAGPSSSGDGAVETVYTSDGNYLVLTELFYGDVGLYTSGLQKYGPTGSLLWSRSYYEMYHKSDGDHPLKISAGAVAEVGDGYVIAGSTYYSVPDEPALGAYYHFKVDKATGSTVAWNKKYRAWPDWNSLWVLDFAKTPDGALVATIGDGVTTANDRIFKTAQSNGNLWWAREYGAHLGPVLPGVGRLSVTTNAYDALLARLTASGTMAESCTAIPISNKTSEATSYPVLRTEVMGGYGESGCNDSIERAAAYNVNRIEAGEYHEANRCAPYPELTVPGGGDFGKVNVNATKDLTVELSNYSGLSRLRVTEVGLSQNVNYQIVSDSCTGETLYPVNQGTPVSCSVTVRFTPKSNGVRKCALTFASNYDSPIKAGLKGTGTGAAAISGKVSTAGGPLAGVTVTLGGAASLTVKTGTDGTYKFSPLADGAYTIKPSKRGYAFVPYRRAATVDVANVTGKDFTATPKTSMTAESGGE